MSIWRRGRLTDNPYLRTAFRVLKAPREVVRRATLARLIQQAQQVAMSRPKARAILGRPISPEEVNAAESILLDPERRILEELLVHATERRSVERLQQLAQIAAEAMKGENEDSAALDPRALRVWLDDLMRQHLAHAPAADPLFGEAELDPVPPFGRAERHS